MKFPDVKENKWYAKDVETASEAGIMTGYEDGTFRPEQPLTRAETAAIVAKLLARKGG